MKILNFDTFIIFEIVHIKKHLHQLNHQNKTNRLQHTISKIYQSIQILNSLKFPQLQIFAKFLFGVCVEITFFF